MGTWAVGIFGDDVAEDVRSIWIECFRVTASAKRATTMTRQQCKAEFADDDDGPVATLALALTLWKYGCLDTETREAAISVIDTGAGLERWREEGAGAERARRKEYDKTKAKLLSPQPPSKDGTFKPKKIEDCGLRPGDFFSLPLPTPTDCRGFFRVVGQRKSHFAILPVVQLLDVAVDIDPTTIDWRNAQPIGFRNYDDGAYPNRRFEAAAIHGWHARVFQRDGLEVHARITLSPAQRYEEPVAGRISLEWKGLAGHVIPSLDTTEWLSPKTLFAECRTCAPTDFERLRDTIMLAIRRTGDVHPFTSAVACRLIYADGDYERALALMTLGETIDPELSKNVTYGHALFGLGRIDEAEALWRASLDEQTGEQRSREEATIASRRAEVEARRRGQPFEPSPYQRGFIE